MRADRRTADPAEVLATALVRACRTLATAGRTDDASRIAAEAWLSVRATRPELGARLDGAMHFIARIEQRHERDTADSSSAGRHDEPGIPVTEEAIA